MDSEIPPEGVLSNPMTQLPNDKILQNAMRHALCTMREFDDSPYA
jgi:hypothetical protein